ncbi:MAG: HAMP domain-containing sensor histidine kinase [Sphingorhabdus sp.]
MRNRGRYFWPKSLYGQILLVVALALLAAQSINAFLLLSGARNRAIIETATMVVGRVVNQIERRRDHGFQLGDVQRDRLGTMDNQRRHPPTISFSVDPAPLTIGRYEAQPELEGRVAEFLAQTDAGLRDIRISSGALALLPPHLRDQPVRRRMMANLHRKERPASQFAVLFSGRLADGRWVNAAGLVRPSETGSILALLAQTLILYIAVLMPLAWVVRRVSKPLEQLTRGVQHIGLAGETGPLAREGPGDIRQLIDAFNAMQSRVSTLLGEKDVMLGAIGHDLKTPLAALRVRVESVEDDAEREKMAATIDEMVTILDDILTLARLGKSGETSQRTDIGALVGSVAEEFSDAVLVEPDQRIIANIRPVLLRRALRNLIGNAITYGKNASISLRPLANSLQIEIEDTGPGIAPDIIDAVFEPFARAENSRSRSTGGSGLGLTIARAIARNHGGDVRLENRDGGGLRAILELPKS